MKKYLCISGMIVFLMASVFFVQPATAGYPEKGLTLIVVYGAGGGTDVTARLLAGHLEKTLGQTVTVMNVTGGGGWVGWSRLAHSKPDGYTIGYMNVPNIYAGYLDPKMKRPENLESFSAIINHVTDPCVWVVRNDSPYKSLKDLIEAAKKNPGKISITAHGYGNDDHLAILDLQAGTGAKFNIVHNDSTAISRSQLLGGHVDVLGANVSEVFQMSQKGEARVIGIMSAQRSSFLPASPTFKEQGFDYEWSVSRGIGGPAGLPENIVKTLADALEKAFQMPEHQEKAKQLGLTLDVKKAAKYQMFLKNTEQSIKKLMGW